MKAEQADGSSFVNRFIDLQLLSKITRYTKNGTADSGCMPSKSPDAQQNFMQ